MSVLKTGDLKVPTQLFEPWVKRIHDGSAISTLSGSVPMKFGKGEAFSFDIGEAEYVGEGSQKGPSKFSKTSQTYEPFKFHKTVRWTEEVQWADEDHQMGVVQEILNLIQPALSRALDFGVIHGINPASGQTVAAMTQKLVSTANKVEFGSDDRVGDVVDEATGLLLDGGGVPDGIAVDPAFAAAISRTRLVDANGNKAQKMYPEFSFRSSESQFDGLSAATARTVGAGGVIDPATGLLSVVGDFSAVRWGIQKSIGLEVIKYGDPDGQGDLKRNNEVAFRAEVVYGWGIAELDRNFAKIVKAADTPEG
ncbi:major capsid protein [Brevibacterium sediminis]|uniref:Major capsid protein n=1 Tax=Brevibacterium sediminis TaxID=1857024 RepID=A0A5C4X3R9_9MICO|nr:major capsid protein [Brevibacterium sediminis]TNM55919.1 major capsid protein [Brevibacterium sediminis]